MLLTLLALAGGVALLAFAADQFVLGAARVALLRRVSPLAVGVVVIGFGTSTPELLVSVLAAARGEPAIAIGNIVGSNLANLSLLLGIGAILVPLAVDSRTVLREASIALGAAVAFGVAVQGGGISRLEGAALLGLMFAALYAVTRRSVGDPLGPETEMLVEPASHDLRAETGRTLLGLIGTLAGAQLLLWAAVDLAERSGLSEGFVGVTLVAVGTSLPELVTVVQSARRRQTDLIVGNLLGSNIFNGLFVGGAAGVFSSTRLSAPELTTVAVLAAIVVSALALVLMWTGRVVTRREGLVLVAGYALLVPLLA